MKYKIRIAVLLLGMVFLAPGGHPAQLAAASFDEPLSSAPDQPASVTAPGSPVVVQDDASLNSHGWAASAAAAPGSTGELGSAVLAAYSLASASAPSGCHLPVSLLAAIGQVESGNLAGRTLDADHRAGPAVLGPVLDGSPYAAIPDTDAGLLDGNVSWDRALGPLQLIPASWRLVGVDMDGDGRRDPQDIDDAAGAAMVYLCAGGRDLATTAGVDAAVLSYNHSSEYLRTVLAWKAVFDRSDLSGVTSLPMFDAMALPTISTTTLPGSTPTPTEGDSTGDFGPATNGHGSAAKPGAKPGATGTSAKPSATPSPAAASPSTTPSESPSGAPSTSPKPSPSESASPDPTTEPAPEPFCSLVDPALPAPSEVPLPEDLLEAGTAVRGAATTDDDGIACIPLVDPVTGEPIVIGAAETSSSQTQSADPGTP
jgi:hypothetical protein